MTGQTFAAPRAFADAMAAADDATLLREYGIAESGVTLALADVAALPVRPYADGPDAVREYDRVVGYAHSRLYAAAADAAFIRDAILARMAAR